jgi:hypothetical protein
VIRDVSCDVRWSVSWSCLKSHCGWRLRVMVLEAVTRACWGAQVHAAWTVPELPERPQKAGRRHACPPEEGGKSPESDRQGPLGRWWVVVLLPESTTARPTTSPSDSCVDARIAISKNRHHDSCLLCSNHGHQREPTDVPDEPWACMGPAAGEQQMIPGRGSATRSRASKRKKGKNTGGRARTTMAAVE